MSYQRRRFVAHRDGQVCRYCGHKVSLWGTYPVESPLLLPSHIEHVWPISLGGADAPENWVLSCEECNVEKGARTPWGWKADLERQGRLKDYPYLDSLLVELEVELQDALLEEWALDPALNPEVECLSCNGTRVWFMEDGTPQTCPYCKPIDRWQLRTEQATRLWGESA